MLRVQCRSSRRHRHTGIQPRGNTVCESAFDRVVTTTKEIAMARGDKSAYSSKQKRKAQHIEQSYEKRGVSDKEAEARAWATVNKQSGGGEKSGSGRKKPASQKAAARRDP